jgi:hypothetical protein
MPLHSIGDLLKTFKRMLEYINNFELKSTMLSFADTRSNESRDSKPFPLVVGGGVTCMAFWRDPKTGQEASGCSNPFFKK